MLIKDSFELFGEERRLHIYLPETNEKCPVIYFFDGHNLFLDSDATYGTSWGLKDYFDEHQTKVIVIGIECNHNGNERLVEFSPYDFNGIYGLEKAKGKEVFDWIINQLKPYIDSKYPTLEDRDNTIIAGSSMGGLMALYGVVKYNDYFSKAVAVSPHHPYCVKRLVEDINETSLAKDTLVYLSFGSNESSNKSRLAKWTKNNLDVINALNNARVFPHLILGGAHNEASWAKETKVWLKELEIQK